jgi:radical SAM superfamily enzyme YgiQ (UPF0313 family)
MSKILLINPNTIQPPVAPLGIEYLCSFLHDNGMETEIFDMNIPDGRSLQEVLNAFRPDITGISLRNLDDSFFGTQESFIGKIQDLVFNIKQLMPETKVVLGGVGFSIMPAESISMTCADFGISGDGEEALLALACSCKNDSFFHHVPNIVTGKGTAEIRYSNLGDFNPQRRFINNRFYYDNGGMVGIETSRGCNRDCIYCADPSSKGRKVRFRNPASVVNEFGQLLEMGIDHFHICDCEFNLIIEHVTGICKMIIERGMGDALHWYAYCVPDGFDLRLAELMKKAGCEGINFGVDHTNNDILGFYRKRHRLNDIRYAADACRKAGIRVMLDLLLGCPKETHDTLKQVFDDMKSIQPTRVGVSYGIRVYPGTMFHTFLIESGFRLPESLLAPFFYVNPAIAGGIDKAISSMIGNDNIFFFNSKEHPAKNYNYNDNEGLAHAISQEGYRGAFWDILYRKFMEGKKKHA